MNKNHFAKPVGEKKKKKISIGGCKKNYVKEQEKNISTSLLKNQLISSRKKNML